MCRGKARKGSPKVATLVVFERILPRRWVERYTEHFLGQGGSFVIRDMIAACGAMLFRAVRQQ